MMSVSFKLSNDENDDDTCPVLNNVMSFLTREIVSTVQVLQFI